MAIIEVVDLVKSYDRKVAVDGVSFTVDEGEIFGILGPNGAGKTTTVECVEGLRAPDVTFWTVWDDTDDGALLGCGALRELDPSHGEIKSMRTASAHRGRGTATRLVEHVVAEARRRGYARLSLETGAEEYFAPARRLYARHGFMIAGEIELPDGPSLWPMWREPR